jgi:transcriptional regulator with XRE-family HTH domain
MTLTSNDSLPAQARAALTHLMRERGVTQVELARVLDVTQVAVSDRVRGRTPLTLADLDRLSRFFDVEPSTFVSGGSSSACYRTGAGQPLLALAA